MPDYSIYPDFAEAILSVVPIFSVGGITSWDYAEPNTIADFSADGTLEAAEDPIIGTIMRRDTLDQAQQSLVISEVFNADWIFIGAKATAINARGVLYKTSINRAFRISGTPETDLEMCIAPLELCEIPDLA